MVTKAEYLEALRGNGYVQGHGSLRASASGQRFCCLGVFCELSTGAISWAGQHPSWNTYAGSYGAIDSRYALRAFGETLGLPGDLPLEILFKVQTHLIHMNDGIGDFEGHKHSFAEIADFLEFELDTFVDEILGEVRYTTA